MKIALVCPYDLARPGGVRSHILGLGEALRASRTHGRSHRAEPSDLTRRTARRQLRDGSIRALRRNADRHDLGAVAARRGSMSARL